MISFHDVTVLVGVALGLVALSFAVSAGLCALVRRLAPKLGLLDRPGGHKGHKRVTPLGGGAAIWVATVGVLATGMLAVYALGPAELPEPLARHVGGVFQQAGEL